MRADLRAAGSAPPEARAPTPAASAPPLLERAVRLVEPALEEALARIGQRRASDGDDEGGHRVPERLLEAMRYAVFSPGKRLRPALVLGGAKAVGGRLEDTLPAACAVEMVHAYSLVHDDLPAMDDDDLRRGKPSCHKQFDEATALLAGDALLTEALALVADGEPLGGGAAVRPKRRLKATVELARAIGAAGMVGGQADDLAADAAGKRGEGEATPASAIVSIHQRKTGRLIRAAVALGGIYGGGSAKEIAALRRFGGAIGLAFQLVDDALDGDGLARREGADHVRAEAARLTAEAFAALKPFGRRGAPLKALAAAMAARQQ